MTSRLISPRTVVRTLGVLVCLCATATQATAECTLSCNANITTFADVGESVYFSGSATPSGCSGTPVYDWDFGDGSPHSSQSHQDHVYAIGGTFTWTMTVTADGKSCTRTGTISVCGLACDATVPATSRAGAPVSFVGNATATGCLSFNRYDWDFGDGSAHSTASWPTHAYATPGTYPWTLKVENFTQSCTQTGSITIAEAVACSSCEVTVPATGVAGTKVQVVSRTLPADCSGSVWYGFDFGDGFVSYWGTGGHSYCQPGTYTWTATVTINGTPCVRTGTIAIAPPTELECSANFTPSGACPLEANFWTGIDDCDDSASYAWDFGDGATATTRSGKHVYPSQGTYPWTVTATWLGASCSSSGTVTVDPPAAITAPATAAPRAGGAPLPIAFHGAAEPASCITSAAWHWDFGDGQSSEEKDPSHTYATPGFYTWMLTVNAEGRSASRKGPIIVGPTPTTYTWAPQLSRRDDLIVDTDFPTEQGGFTAGKNGIRSTGDRGRTWGSSWDTSCYAVHFLDASTGFYTAYCGFAWTTNGGATWNEGYWYSDCFGFSLTDIFATTPTQVWQSDSAGDLWRWTYTPGTGYYGHDWTQDRYFSTGASHLQSIYFTDPGNGWGVGNSGKIIRITNAASATPGFATQPSGVTANLRGIVMLSPTNGWVVGDNGTILTTSNGGATWTPRASGTTINFRGIDFRDATNGWIVGESGLVLGTSDGGATWRAEVTPNDKDLRAVSAPPGARAFASGADGTLLQRLPYACPPVELLPATLPDASTASPYSQQVTPSGGTSPYTVGLTAGTLPDWLQLSDAGLLSGSLHYPGSSSFALRAVDADSCSGDRAYQLTVECALTCSAGGYQDRSGPVPNTAIFYASASASCGVRSFHWTFGDGKTSTEEDPVHTYASPGTYQWTMTVTAGSRSCSQDGEVYIRATCAVSCSASVSAATQPWAAVPFVGEATATQECWSEVSYDWDFGDGSPHATTASTDHEYAAPGDYTWRLTATAGSRSCTRSGVIAVHFGAHRRLQRGPAGAP